jgi:hypothetical protein
VSLAITGPTIAKKVLSSFPNETRVAEQLLLAIFKRRESSGSIYGYFTERVEKTKACFHYRERAGNVRVDTPPHGAAEDAKLPGSRACPGETIPFICMLHDLKSLLILSKNIIYPYSVKHKNSTLTTQNFYYIIG